MLETLEQEEIALEIPKVIFTTESIMDKENAQKIKEHGKVLAAMGGGAGIAVMMGGL